MYKFDFTKDEYEKLSEDMMLNEELNKIFEMRIKGYSVVEMSMKMGMSESSVKRRINKIARKLEKAIK